MKVYQVVSDPYLDENHNWHISMLWVDGDKQGQGQLNIPDYGCGMMFQKYFRRNVDPLEPEQVSQMIEDYQKGTMQ